MIRQPNHALGDFALLKWAPPLLAHARSLPGIAFGDLVLRTSENWSGIWSFDDFAEGETWGGSERRDEGSGAPNQTGAKSRGAEGRDSVAESCSSI